MTKSKLNLPEGTECSSELLERIVVKGPREDHERVLQHLFNQGWNVTRSGPEVKDLRTTGRYHFIAEKEITNDPV